MFSFKSLKATLFAEYSILKYIIAFQKMTNEQLNAIVLNERSCRGWCSQRSYYLAALRYICHKREIEYCW